MRVEKLPVNGSKCYLFKDRLNRFYFSGTDIAEGFLLIAEKSAYFTDLRYYSAAKTKIAGAGLVPRVFNGISDVAKEIKAQNINTVYIDYTRTTLSEYEEYKRFLGGAKISDCSALLASLRSIKGDAEILSVKAACNIVQRAVKETFSVAREGVTEKELKKFLENRFIELGSEGAAFDTIVAFGKNAAVPHHETGNSALRKGDAVLIDAGCKVNGYCSDITRTAFFGKPDAEFLKAYDAVLRANIKAEEEIRAGISGKDADKIARDLLFERGYGEYFTHSLGHGVGLEIHENPYLSPKSEETLAENTVFTVEPGVYMDGKFGIRIEDTCVMKGGRAVRLFDDDKALFIINEK